MAPLKIAHNSGRWAWSAEDKEKYVNYLGNDDSLIAATAGTNRSKGTKGPEEWGPTDRQYWCEYALDWTEIKAKWGLTMTQIEAEIVMDMLYTRNVLPDVEVEVRETVGISVGVHKPTPEPVGPVYGSCEDAEAAGEERAQSSRGGGQGVPQTSVPFAWDGDGDGDGVACER